MRITVVKVKCTICGSKKEIGPNETPATGYPMCDKCYMPMFPVSAKKRKNYKSS